MSGVNLAQLPVPELCGHFSPGNIPLAAGYLKSHVQKKNPALAHKISILPRPIANFGGDACIIHELLANEPDAIGLTSYMWNIERNLALAERIREKSPRAAIVLGGSELDASHFAIRHPAISSIILGEGETAFPDFLDDMVNNRPLRKIYQGHSPLNLAESVNPYLSGVLLPEAGEAMYMETMRGCPSTCSYCFYSKANREIRRHPADELPQLFELARRYNVPEIYIMDPSFNVTPGLAERLAKIQEYNPTGIPIHTEMRLESVTPELADLMKNAGFRSVEVGLQSIRRRPLEAVRRTWKRDRFIQGAQLLMERGVHVKTGIILGLPEDTLDGFEKTLDFLVNLKLDPWLEVYVLSLLPGTQLREESETFGLQSMRLPPYWVTGSPGFTEQEMKLAVERLEYKLDMEFHPPLIPRFRNGAGDLIHFLDMRFRDGDIIMKESFRLALEQPERIGNSLTLLLNEQTPLQPISALARSLRDENPSTMIQLVLDWRRIPAERDLIALQRLFPVKNNYFDRLHHFKMDEQQSWSVRFFHLTGDFNHVEAYLYDAFPCDLIVKFSPEWLKKGTELLDPNPLLLTEEAYWNAPSVRKKLTALYQGCESYLIVASIS